MNKLFFVTLEGGYTRRHSPFTGDRGVYVAADNKFEAREIAYESDYIKEYECCTNLHPELDVVLVKEHYWKGSDGYNEEGRVVYTDIKGEPTLQQLNDMYRLWFDCVECGWDDFEINGDQYTCRNCGKTKYLPGV